MCKSTMMWYSMWWSVSLAARADADAMDGPPTSLCTAHCRLFRTCTYFCWSSYGRYSCEHAREKPAVRRIVRRRQTHPRERSTTNKHEHIRTRTWTYTRYTQYLRSIPSRRCDGRRRRRLPHFSFQRPARSRLDGALKHACEGAFKRRHDLHKGRRVVRLVGV